MPKKKPDPFLVDLDNPELTAEEIRAAKPARDAMPPELYAELTKRRRGQRGLGKKPARVLISLRVPPETLAAYQATGTGWRTRASDVLADAITGRLVRPGEGGGADNRQEPPQPRPGSRRSKAA